MRWSFTAVWSLELARPDPLFETLDLTLNSALNLHSFHETYCRVVIDLTESLTSGGFRRILILNGHGGNIAPVTHGLTIL